MHDNTKFTLDLLSKMLIHEKKDENEYTKSLLKQYVDLENDKKFERIYINYK